MAYDENKNVDIEALEIPDMLFEVSWEVCNKVGGINTVISSKASILTNYLDNYYLIGPYIKDTVGKETVQAVPPEEFRWAFAELEKEGIKCFFGKWNINGVPKVILIDFEGLKGKSDELKKELWENYGIDSIYANWDFSEPMLFSYAVARVLEKLKGFYPYRRVVGQYHEWMTGLALLFLKTRKVDIKSIFTTHATMLGRALSGSGYDLYNTIDTIDPMQEARNVGVIEKHTSEAACAKHADVFSTVSQITAIEAEKLLGKKPDILLPNGLDSNLFPTFEEISIKHRENRTKIREFLSYYFSPYYPMDLENNLIFFISGRYEYRNKGIDILIKALEKLNSRLKASDSKKTVTVFFWIPSGVTQIKNTLLEHKEKYDEINSFITKNLPKIKEKLLFKILETGSPENIEVFSKEDIDEIEADLKSFKIDTHMPPVSAFQLSDEINDHMINELRESGLDNTKDDKVKVILYPVYLNGNDNLLNLKYYDAILGSHLGIFPSYYEPWGYTPLEGAALGIPSITTDLAGFGRYIEENNEGKKGGVRVLKRYNKTDEEVVEDLTNEMFDFLNQPYKNRVQEKLLAKKYSEKADWNEMIKNYFVAYSKSLEK